MGIRDHPIAARSPWQNGYVERLIGSVRRECLGHIVVFGEAHLRRVFKTYAIYYSEIRTHLSLDKDAPYSRCSQTVGAIVSDSDPRWAPSSIRYGLSFDYGQRVLKQIAVHCQGWRSGP